MSSGFDRRGGDRPRPDQVRRQTVLGSTATYRVVEVGLDTVVLEVIDAPGLARGASFTFDLAAVAQMDVVTDAQTES